MPIQDLSARGETVKEDLGKIENEIVANHSPMDWAESTTDERGMTLKSNE